MNASILILADIDVDDPSSLVEVQHALDRWRDSVRFAAMGVARVRAGNVVASIMPGVDVKTLARIVTIGAIEAAKHEAGA